MREIDDSQLDRPSWEVVVDYDTALASQFGPSAQYSGNVAHVHIENIQALLPTLNHNAQEGRLRLIVSNQPPNDSTFSSDRFVAGNALKRGHTDGSDQISLCIVDPTNDVLLTDVTLQTVLAHELQHVADFQDSELNHRENMLARKLLLKLCGQITGVLALCTTISLGFIQEASSSSFDEPFTPIYKLPASTSLGLIASWLPGKRLLRKTRRIYDQESPLEIRARRTDSEATNLPKLISVTE